MATKKDFSQDANNMFPVDVTKKEASRPSPQLADLPNQRAKTEVLPNRKPSDNADTLIRRTYYITENIYRALKIRAASSDSPAEKDQSAIVRIALERYLNL